MFTIALTGGIGSGKSTVAELFKNLGVCIVDADVIAREVVKPNHPALREIRNTFGDEFITASGELDRAKMRSHVFSDSKMRRKLETIVHPRVRAGLSAQLARCQSDYAIAVIPLLIESNWQQEFDRVLVIDTSEDMQIERVQNRSSLQRDEILQIINSQVQRAKRLKFADDVIVNDSDIENLNTQVVQLHNHYQQLSRQII